MNKEFIRYDKNLRAIAGSSVRRKTKPKNGIWKEVIERNCCDLNGEWFFLDVYAPPFEAGLLDMPNHEIMESSTDPNMVGTGLVMLYINLRDSAGNFKSQLTSMEGNSGTLTLSQGLNSVTYGFEPGAFFVDMEFGMVVYDTIFASSIPGSIVVLSPSAGDFNTILPISIFVNII